MRRGGPSTPAVAPRHLTITERRRPWREDLGPEWTSFPIARLRYTATDRSWTLYWRDRNLRFHRYDRLAPSRRVDKLLDEIDDDPIEAVITRTLETTPANATRCSTRSLAAELGLSQSALSGRRRSALSP